MMKKYHDMLDALAAEDNLRMLRCGDAAGKYVIYDGRRYLNMSSNDYLGLASDTSLQEKFLEEMAWGGKFVMSSSASRLMTGNVSACEELERAVAALYPGKSALVVGNGYAANSGCLPALTGSRDLVVADKLVHASIIDGLRLCDCDWTRYNHNDMDHLRSILEKKRAQYDNVWVVTESVFSMDGDRAPLKHLADLKEQFDLSLYLDEAHAFGVFGTSGAGCAAQQGLDARFDVIVGTFGKALASYGAFLAVDPLVREVLINRMRTLIFSTGLPPVNMLWTKWMVERLPDYGYKREKLMRLVSMLRPEDPQATQIIPIPAGTNPVAVAMSDKLREAGFWTTPIRWPTVPKGQARVRISLSAAMDESDISQFLETWRSIG